MTNPLDLAKLDEMEIAAMTGQPWQWYQFTAALRNAYPALSARAKIGSLYMEIRKIESGLSQLDGEGWEQAARRRRELNNQLLALAGDGGAK